MAMVYIKMSFHNTIVTVIDGRANVLSWCSSGVCKFKGRQKTTAFATKIVITRALKSVLERGFNGIDIKVSGPGFGRNVAIRAIIKMGFKVFSLKDITPLPYNGCRPRKRRRT
uniref:Small ribosomal subunit protein uS11c n=1 Tax=Euglena longa TaxID=3037 RepID=RR11_EUGLO|nr:ribosomal protein S11 [Euglena longa]P58136.1 RecName: Full=Small ribosomal subunit protein uS11c; AltName: Full=Plastid 30S ribosomal protein S11 [Euglena longa]CAC24616.1 ribosomal protein S11 [Euglena longa]